MSRKTTRGNWRQAVRSVLSKVYDKFGHSNAWSRFKTEPFRITQRRKKKKFNPKDSPVYTNKSQHISQLGNLVNLDKLEL